MRSTRSRWSPTNRPGAPYRGYGKEQAALVMERIMDLIAVDLDIDPAEVRRRNFIPAEAFPLWLQTKHIDSGDYPAALEKALHMADYQALRLEQEQARREGRHMGNRDWFLELTPAGGELPGDAHPRARHLDRPRRPSWGSHRAHRRDEPGNGEQRRRSPIS